MADSHLEGHEANWIRTVKDLTAGAAGGIAQVLLGKDFPFSTRELLSRRKLRLILH